MHLSDQKFRIRFTHDEDRRRDKRDGYSSQHWPAIRVGSAGACACIEAAKVEAFGALQLGVPLPADDAARDGIFG